jgi:3-deoxy-D-manno-octulosonate 8-phosphate phosphatase (KDO 8-P phosphatase)
MENVGIACATADAVDPVKRTATYVTRSRGGHGAVREFCDWLLSPVTKRGQELVSERS